jgi:hypothetical protein
VSINDIYWFSDILYYLNINVWNALMSTVSSHSLVYFNCIYMQSAIIYVVVLISIFCLESWNILSVSYSDLCKQPQSFLSYCLDLSNFYSLPNILSRVRSVRDIWTGFGWGLLHLYTQLVTIINYSVIVISTLYSSPSHMQLETDS